MRVVGLRGEESLTTPRGVEGCASCVLPVVGLVRFASYELTHSEGTPLGFPAHGLSTWLGMQLRPYEPYEASTLRGVGGLGWGVVGRDESRPYESGVVGGDESRPYESGVVGGDESRPYESGVWAGRWDGMSYE